MAGGKDGRLMKGRPPTGRICRICVRKHYADGLCQVHYMRRRRYGNPLVCKRLVGGHWRLTECAPDDDAAFSVVDSRPDDPDRRSRCLGVDCDEPISRYGMCREHAAEWDKTGAVPEGHVCAPRRSGE